MSEKTGKFVSFVPDKVKVLLVDSLYEHNKQLPDPRDGELKMKHVMELHVVEEDLEACDKWWGVTAMKAQATIRGYHEANGFLNRRWDIVLHGVGFMREYSFSPHV